MTSLNNVEKAGSDIEKYVNDIESIYNQQLDRINFMKRRLMNFKNLLKEEEEVSQKFLKINEMMASYVESGHNSNIHSQRHSNLSGLDGLSSFDD